MPPADPEHTLSLRALDALEVPFVCFNAAIEPFFISSRAARILNIRGRQELQEHRAVLEPLAELARRLLAGKETIERQLLAAEHPDIIEAVFAAADGRTFNGFAFARLLEMADAPEAGLTGPAAVTVFHDLTPLQPLFYSIEQMRRIRTFVVLVSSLFSHSLARHSGDRDIVAAYRDTESDLFRHHPAELDSLTQTDLQSGLSTAIDIVDPLISAWTKILQQVKTSALLAISLPNFLRIICHLLLEAADFAGAHGSVRVGGEMKDTQIQSQMRVIASYQTVEISITAQRQNDISLHSSPMELFLYRRCLPQQYKVSFSGEVQNQHFSVQQDGTDFTADAAGAKLSENLQIASHIASSCRIIFSVRRPQPDTLSLVTQFKMAAPDSGAGSR